MGVCLPLACSSIEVNQLVELSAREAKLDSQRTVYIITAKSPHNLYIMSEDPIFIVVMYVSFGA